MAQKQNTSKKIKRSERNTGRVCKATDRPVKRQRRKSNAGSPMGGLTEMQGPDGLYARKDGIARQKEREAAAARRTAFLQRQADTAAQIVGNSSLNGLARKVADLLIGKFPRVAVPEGVKRTTAAQEVAVNMLSTEEKRRSVAVELGIKKARLALREAYDIVNNSPVEDEVAA